VFLNLFDVRRYNRILIGLKTVREREMGKKIMRKMQEEKEGVVRGTIVIDTQGRGGGRARTIYCSEGPSTVPARPSGKYKLEASYSLRNWKR
jgi:hypothetical protein